MGLMHNGAVYALWDYSAEFGDELSFREGEPVTVLRRDGPEETDWWWASLHGQEGYVPRNYFGVSRRVRGQWWNRGKVHLLSALGVGHLMCWHLLTRDSSGP